MLKGCQKKIIQIKDTGSKYFEEAYFIIKNESLKSEINECNIIRDATAIVNEYISGSARDKIRKRNTKGMILFSIGFFIGLAMSVSAFFIFYWSIDLKDFLW